MLTKSHKIVHCCIAHCDDEDLELATFSLLFGGLMFTIMMGMAFVTTI